MSDPDFPCPDDLVAFAERLADAAGVVAMRHFRTAVTVDEKPDLTPVTIADRQAEAEMRRLIEQRYPEHGVIGEEAGRQGEASRYVWVLDPIDGTRRFISGHPGFGTLIALLEDGRPLLGVISMPALGERWVGARGHATLFKNAAGVAEARVRPCPSLDKATLFATSPYMFIGPARPAFERVREAAKTPLFGGECHAYGLLASGYVDLVIEADMGLYDYLAQVPVIEGAGGIMTDWQGLPLGLGSGDQVLAAGDSACHKEALRLLSGEP
ncbi:MAG: histidinol-phosphatase [Pseudomonadota bacterium]